MRGDGRGRQTKCICPICDRVYGDTVANPRRRPGNGMAVWALCPRCLAAIMELRRRPSATLATLRSLVMDGDVADRDILPMTRDQGGRPA